MDKFLFVLTLLVVVFISNIAVKKNDVKIYFLSILILVIISGFRGITVGVDTPLYYNAFINNFPLSWQFEEIGFRFIVNFLMSILPSPTYIMLIFSFIINYFIMMRLWDFKEKCNLSFMIFIYVFTFFIDSLNIMRQFIALAIMFYFTRYLDKKKYFLFIIIVIMCSFIHTTAFLGFLFFLIYFWKNLSKRKRLVLVIPMICFSLFFIFFLLNYESSHILNYFSSDNSIMNLNFTYIFRILIFMISYYLNFSKKRIICSNIGFNVKDISFLKTDIYFKYVSFFYMLGLCFSSLGMFFSFMSRFGYYYLIFELVYWGYLTYKNKNGKLNMIMISIYVLYVFSLELIRNGSSIFPFYLNIV